VGSLYARKPSSDRTCQRHLLASWLQRWTKYCYQAFESGTANFPACHFAISDVATKPSNHQAASAPWPACACASPDLAFQVNGVIWQSCQGNRPDLATRPSRLGLPTIQLLMSSFLMWPPSSRASTPPHLPHGQLLVSPAFIWPDL
jgi:hypothetical protein